MADPVTQSLCASLDFGLPVWLLIDPLLGEPLALEAAGAEPDAAALQRLREAQWQRSVLVAALPEDFGIAPAQLPYLVGLHGADDPWLRHSLQWAQDEWAQAWEDGLQGQGRAAMRVGGWLQTAGDGQALVQQLSQAMLLRTRPPQAARYLRLADRRCLDWLRCTVADARLLAALPSLRRWVWLDACGQVEQMAQVEQVEQGSLSARAPIPSPTPLWLSATEYAQLLEAARVHPTLARWLGERPAAAPQPGCAEALGRAYAAVQQARQQAQRHPGHFPQDEDLCAWAALSLLQPAFSRSRAYTDWLASPSAAPEFEPFNQSFHGLRCAPAPVADEHP